MNVLVTGGTGFIAQHCMLALLAQGHTVRTTIRSPKREAEVRAYLKRDDVSFVTANLNADSGWAEAVANCDYVIHGASPTPSETFATEDAWIKPAVEGNLRVLRASRDAGVKRVVLTSAFGAIGVGHPPQTRPFNETDWSNLSGNVAPYQKSKTLSERAAWDFIAQEGKGMELAAVNPVGVLGPVLGPDYSHSIRIIKTLMSGQPGCPKIYSGFVDVRDVADLHVLAMTRPEASGERFLAIADQALPMVEVARVLKRRMGASANKVSTRELPNWLVRLLSYRNPTLKMVVPLLGVNMNATNEKAKRLLGWNPRSSEEAIVASAESLVRLGLLD